MSVILRLSPAHPPLWRDEHTMQLGIDQPVLIASPTAWQIALVHRLETGFDDDALPRIAAACGATTAQARRFVTDISDALPALAPRFDLAVCLVTDAADHDRARAFAGEIAAAGSRITDSAPIVVVLTPVALVPRTTASWMADDRVHIPVVVSTSHITVGPVIVPGHTACAQCLAQTRRDADPAWPKLAVQMLGRLTLPPTALFTEAARVVLELLDGFDASSTETTSVTISATSPRSWSRHQPHADCGCRSPEGIVTAFAASDQRHEPTTTRASIRRA